MHEQAIMDSTNELISLMMMLLVVPVCMITAGACQDRYDELVELSVTLNPVLARLYSIHLRSAHGQEIFELVTH